MHFDPQRLSAAAATVQRARNWAWLLILTSQNLTIYWAHYFRGAGFPWDFSMSYFAMVAFWTAAVREGIFPQWIPFQQMGYPFALQVQSGMNYPPLWLFPALNIPYTLHAAVVFQCGHVLAGSVGMFMLARHLYSSRTLAALAGMAFQLFGGFFSNAEHVDIVRAFACAPWLLYVYSLDHRPDAPLQRRVLLIPPVLCLFLTGGYPGNVLAGGVVIALFVGLQLVGALAGGASPSWLTVVAARVAGFSLLGCGMAILQLGPVWLFRDQFVRANPLTSVPREGLWLQHLPGLFLSNSTLPGEISMTSTYISLPVLLLATFTPWAALKRSWVLVSLAAVAAIMAAGDRTFIGQTVRSVVPALGLSRFPSSDYRVFVAIVLILLSIAGLRAIAQKQLSGRSMAARTVLGVAWLFMGLAQVHHSIGRETALALAVAVASLLTIFVLWRRQAGLTAAGVAVIGVLISIDAVRVLPEIAGWREPDIEAYYAGQRWPAYTRNRGRQLVTSAVVHNLPSTRPARIVPPGLVRWSGYLQGGYLTSDLTPNVLRTANVITANGAYHTYMLEQWSPLLLPPAPRGDRSSETVLTDAVLTDRSAAPGTAAVGGVRQSRYGINDIVYEVSLKEARVLVENETYFPGWRARLSPGGSRVIEAFATNGVFRSWLLPAGDYTMVATFSFPHLMTLRLVCATSFLTWASLCLVRWYRRPRTAAGSMPLRARRVR